MYIFGLQSESVVRYKYLTTPLSEGGGEPGFVAYAIFHGVNTLTTQLGRDMLSWVLCASTKLAPAYPLGPCSPFSRGDILIALSLPISFISFMPFEKESSLDGEAYCQGS